MRDDFVLHLLADVSEMLGCGSEFAHVVRCVDRREAQGHFSEPVDRLVRLYKTGCAQIIILGWVCEDVDVRRFVRSTSVDINQPGAEVGFAVDGGGTVDDFLFVGAKFEARGFSESYHERGISFLRCL